MGGGGGEGGGRGGGGGGGGGGGELKGYLCTLNAGHVGSNKLAYIGT